jgi:molybdate transport system regulatory protein
MQTPAVRFRIDLGRQQAVGPGKVALLEHIERGGSLSQAARELGMSYRRAWLLLESLNSCFLEPVATTATGGRGGGGATLTVFGQQLIRAYRDFEAEIQAYAVQRFRPIVSRTRSRPRAPAGGRRRGAPVVSLKGR